MAEIQLIIVLRGRHFVRHLGICNRICQTSTTDVRCHYAQFSEKKRSLYINKWLSYSQIKCFTAAILSSILEFVIRFASNSYRLCPVLFCAI